MSGQEIHKRSDFPAPTPRKRDMNPPGPPRPVGKTEMWIGGVILAAIAALIVGGLGWYIYAAGNWGPDEVSESEAATFARALCEDNVERQLKAPSTASHQKGTTTGSKASGWIITGSTDAQNSFGATVRTRWTCDADWNESTQEASAGARLIG